MGILDSIRGKIDEAEKAYNPMRKVADAISVAPTPGKPSPDDAQRQYEAREKAMNRNNPHYRNVDNSGLTKERLP